MAVIRSLSRFSALACGLPRLLARVRRRLGARRSARAERQALLDVLAKPGDRLLDDAGLAREEAERRLDVSRISPWDRWQL